MCAILGGLGALSRPFVCGSIRSCPLCSCPLCSQWPLRVVVIRGLGLLAWDGVYIVWLVLCSMVRQLVIERRNLSIESAATITELWLGHLLAVAKPSSGTFFSYPGLLIQLFSWVG